MSASKASPFKRHTTRYRGITYRKRSDGSRTYSVYWAGSYVPAGSTEEEAVGKQAELRGKKNRGEVVIPAKRTFRDVAVEHLGEVELKPGWAAEYRRMLESAILPEWGDRPIGSFRPRDVLALAKKLQTAGRSSSTVANYLKPARGVFAHAVEEEYISASPFAGVKRGKLPSCNVTREHREWSTEDVNRFIVSAYERDARPDALRDYGLLIELKVRLGLRLGELLGLQYADFDKGEGVLHVRRQWTRDGRVDVPKTKKSLRRVTVPQSLYAKVAARKLRLGAGDGDFLSAHKPGASPLSHSNFRRRAWSPAVAAASFAEGPKVTPHDARHAFASQMASLGLEAGDVAEALGHTSATITERIYVHSFDRAKREDRIRAAQAKAMQA